MRFRHSAFDLRKYADATLHQCGVRWILDPSDASDGAMWCHVMPHGAMCCRMTPQGPSTVRGTRQRQRQTAMAMAMTPRPTGGPEHETGPGHMTGPPSLSPNAETS